MTELIHGDCIEVLRSMPDCSVDAVVTDPPYGLSFMGKKWDYDVPGVEVWAECLRVLKPGGHLLAFAGTRTQHRMAVRIEDAGFEIRDMIAWVYGSGFPKSLDVSKAIDKNNGEVGRLHKFTEWMRGQGVTIAAMWPLLIPYAKNEATAKAMAQHYISSGQQPAIPTAALWRVLRPICGQVPEWVDELVERIEAEREVVGIETRYNEPNGIVSAGRDERTLIERKITAPATDAARQWQGWGTALKPALEPITVARKPLIGTVAENVLTWGTGGVNVEASRVGYVNELDKASAGFHGRSAIAAEKSNFGQLRTGFAKSEQSNHRLGRWPANFIHDGSEEATDLLKDSARFFYCAKASKADRGENNYHITVKPTDLMRYLCRLVTPPGGVVLDPFMGSGSTGKAAALEGFNFIGIEREAEYVAIAQARINHVTND